MVGVDCRRKDWIGKITGVRGSTSIREDVDVRGTVKNVGLLLFYPHQKQPQPLQTPYSFTFITSSSLRRVRSRQSFCTVQIRGSPVRLH